MVTAVPLQGGNSHVPAWMSLWRQSQERRSLSPLVCDLCVGSVKITIGHICDLCWIYEECYWLHLICVGPVRNAIGHIWFCFFPVKEDWNVRITKLRKQVEEIFNLKFGKWGLVDLSLAMFWINVRSSELSEGRHQRASLNFLLLVSSLLKPSCSFHVALLLWLSVSVRVTGRNWGVP